MPFPNIDDLLKSIPNRYELCVAAARRARQLNLGVSPLISLKDTDKVTSIALEEIRRGKVRVVEAPDRDVKVRVPASPMKEEVAEVKG